MGTENGINWINWAQRIILLLCTIMISWAMAQIGDLRTRTEENAKDLASIKSNRFTNKDGETHLVAITRNATNMETVMDDIKEIKTDQKEILNILHKTANK